MVRVGVFLSEGTLLVSLKLSLDMREADKSPHFAPRCVIRRGPLKSHLESLFQGLDGEASDKHSALPHDDVQPSKDVVSGCQLLPDNSNGKVSNTG